MKNRFVGLEEFDRLLDVAARSSAEYDFAQLPKDGREFLAAREMALELIHRNNMDELAYVMRVNGTVGQLLRVWSEDDNLADTHDALLNVRMILVALKAKREIGGD